MKTKPRKRNRFNPDQPELVGLIWRPRQQQFRLCAGDVILYENRLCRVVRVNECAAVILMNRPIRQFMTRFDKPVRFTPSPAVVRICSNSEVEILNRKPDRGRKSRERGEAGEARRNAETAASRPNHRGSGRFGYVTA